MVWHPQFGRVVRKLYNPGGLSSPRMIGRKMQLAKDLKSSPLLAKTHGFQRTPYGGRMTFHEYVQGAAPTRAKARAIREQLQRQGSKRGWDIQDVRAANIRGDKAVDVLPFRRGEVMQISKAQREAYNLPSTAIGTTPKGSRVASTPRSELSTANVYRTMTGNPARAARTAKPVPPSQAQTAVKPGAIPQASAPTQTAQAAPTRIASSKPSRPTPRPAPRPAPRGRGTGVVKAPSMQPRPTF
jgi:hypothetical protein